MFRFDRLKKKTDPAAKVLSIQDDSRFNPFGGVQSGIARDGRATQPAGSDNRFRIRIALSDGTFLETTVTGRLAGRLLPGSVGKLVYRGNAILRFDPQS